MRDHEEITGLIPQDNENNGQPKVASTGPDPTLMAIFFEQCAYMGRHCGAIREELNRQLQKLSSSNQIFSKLSDNINQNLTQIYKFTSSCQQEIQKLDASDPRIPEMMGKLSKDLSSLFGQIVEGFKMLADLASNIQLPNLEALSSAVANIADIAAKCVGPALQVGCNIIAAGLGG